MTPAQRVRSAVRRSRQLSVASLVLAGVAVATTNIMVAVGACGGWLLALIAVILVLRAVLRVHEVPGGEGAQVNRLVLLVVAVFCLALLLGQTLILGSLVSSIRPAARTTTSIASLKGIGRVTIDHAREKGAYPSSLQDFIDSGVATPKSFWAPADPEAGGKDSPDPKLLVLSCSYIYVPGHGTWANDPRIIIAYERMSFGSSGPLISRRPVRCVLFDDGRVEILEEDAFQRAWQQDRQRRRELGWPIAPNEPAQPPASQPGPVVTWPAG